MGSSKAVVLKLEKTPEQQGRLLKHRLLRPYPRISNAVSMGEGLKTEICSKFPGDADAVIWGHTLRSAVLRYTT